LLVKEKLSKEALEKKAKEKGTKVRDRTRLLDVFKAPVRNNASASKPYKHKIFVLLEKLSNEFTV